LPQPVHILTQPVRRARLGVLFNHDMLHQVAHCAPIAAELLRGFPDIDVTILSSSAAQETLVRDILARAQVPMPRFVRLGVSLTTERLDRAFGKVLPLRRIAALRFNLDIFRGLDAVLAPETTCTLLKTKFGLSHLKLIHSRHGAGDRSVGFRPVTRQFDLTLVAGPKVKERLIAEGLVDDGNCRIVGYPKFDLMTADRTPPPRFFRNDNPTILYNPHLDPNLSSWYDWGRTVLDLFMRRGNNNLIFAPHVMLFERRLHGSLEKFRLRWRHDLKSRYLKRANIHVDLGSTNCIDMTYTRAADIYMGDASSQIYEFLMQPRPCLFLNPRRIDWQGNPNFAYWRFGEVLDRPTAIEGAIDRAFAVFPRYEELQREGFEGTFDLGEIPSSLRAARAVAEFLGVAERM
jgi:hypothetical protein